MAYATIEKLEKNVARDTIENAHIGLGLNYTELASALGVNRRTVLRYRQHNNIPSPKVRFKMNKLREIQFLLGEVFGTPEEGLLWLYTPVQLLRRQRPIDRIREGELEQVVSVLSGLHTGAYS